MSVKQALDLLGRDHVAFLLSDRRQPCDTFATRARGMWFANLLPEFEAYCVLANADFAVLRVLCEAS